MTKGELKAHCIRQVEQCEMWAKVKEKEPSGKVYEEHKLILELLEQEPCEDVISRQAALDIYDDYNIAIENGELEAYRKHRKRLLKLPPVNSQEPKTGQWREDIDNNRRWDRVRFYCSECGDWQTYGKSHYCPNCGAKMVEPQESEGEDGTN